MAARVNGLQRSTPRGLLRCYYCLQPGFEHRDYGARLFGPAINCLPTYSEADQDLIPADWLNSTCTVYRTELFRWEQFPEFEECSAFEDVHLSARTARTHLLCFRKHALYTHLSTLSSHIRNCHALARMKIANQRRVASEVLGVRGWRLEWGLALHRLFVTACWVCTRPSGWRDTLRSTWN